MNSSDEPSRALPVEAGAQPLAALIARVFDAPTPDLALVLALLRALQAQPLRHDARDGASPQNSDPSNAK